MCKTCKLAINQLLQNLPERRESSVITKSATLTLPLDFCLDRHALTGA